MSDSMTEIEQNTSTEERAAFVMIPPNYTQTGVVPICVRTIDDRGRPVDQGWIEAVVPVADPLRSIARRVIGDVWRVSELAESSVHALCAKHGAQLGQCPAGRIYVDASWRARDLAAGSRRARVGRDVELKDYMLEALRDPRNPERTFENREILERLEERLWDMGETDVLIMLHLYQTGAGDQIAEVFGIPKDSRERNALAQRFRRSIARARKTL